LELERGHRRRARKAEEEVGGLKDDIIVLKIADNVKIEMLKSAVTAVTAHDVE
jgi:hypothetical protein